MMKEEIIIGKKGEIPLKHSIRELSGIKSGDKVLVEAYPNKLLINKILSIDEVFKLPVIAKGTTSEIERELDEESRINY